MANGQERSSSGLLSRSPFMVLAADYHVCRDNRAADGREFGIRLAIGARGHRASGCGTHHDARTIIQSKKVGSNVAHSC